MKKLVWVGLLSLVSLLVLTGFGFKKDSPEERRKEIDEATAEVLADLYREVPGSKKYLDRAAGYAVFSSLGLNVFVVSTASGKGKAHYKSSGKDVYMKMYSAGGGIGMGVKDFRLVFAFESEAALNKFVEEGWTAGAQADAAATHDDEGDAAALAIDVSPGVKLFQLTESGLALQATIQGTKYWKDDELN
jgi:lipid-binding SYLF domain-containing protein